MKTRKTMILSMLGFLFAIFLTGCGSDEDSQDSPNSVDVFFDSAFATSALLSGINKDTCCLINSGIELQRHYHGDEVLLPSIDFSKASLVIGCIYAPYLGCIVEEKEMSVTDGMLNVSCHIQVAQNRPCPCFLNYTFGDFAQKQMC